MPDTRALALWEHVATTRAEGALTVAAAPDSRLCPPGWCGIVRLDSTTLATAPTAEQANLLRAALTGVEAAEHTSPGALKAALPITGALGPATLAYLTETDFRPVPASDATRLPAESDALEALLQKVGPEEAGESGLTGLNIPLFTLTEGSEVIAAAGYKVLPGNVAHLSVLTAPTHRGRGLAKKVSSAAVSDALAQNLLPQWRARPKESRGVALTLGFRELGSQLSLHLG
ncbi:GNAT family N-acetyltransferase [Nocardiopsis valliformis]|uniref:GNAT family N-acetyltransferase n=1 Tax=Nocardiopsis valliformis TaxID=239974 RepID=UPI0003491E36|nr:GNAT family N-acetyltransferase [Nocardiopsis valliformis]